MSTTCSQPSALSPDRFCLHKSAPRSFPSQVTGGVLGQLHLPFSPQVPCWILKDCMMKKCALQITYRSMQFLILPHALDNSFKSQFIACYLTFHKLRGVLWTVKKPNQKNTTQTQQTNQSFTQGYLGKRIKREGKGAASLSLKRIGFSG